MPKYLVRGSYTAEGLQGVLRDGGSGRLAAVEHVVTSCGGSLEAMYFAYGDDDFYCILDFPDHLTMAAVAMTVKATGAVRSSAVPLLTADEVDTAARRSVDFAPPGA
ncbi:GYD domain-containing protein [Kitasatospora mediocidica]|uniref:GYD domain-containing protein n=1 Tax=Kitasatospora mediocidica TaxID=58352 RepID=UPI00056594D0|nr:GYD domain-containing protein [Kitasatospora mediocidica]